MARKADSITAGALLAFRQQQVWLANEIAGSPLDGGLLLFERYLDFKNLPRNIEVCSPMPCN
jgi:hypothetical protein